MAKPPEARDLAEVVDHKVPHRGDPALFWNVGNWQALSKRHHDRKTATQDSRFAGSH
jgi:5-methylcytosine-specific restriction protein A